MIDSSPGPHPNGCYAWFRRCCVCHTQHQELFEEQDEKENVEARSKIKLFFPIEEVLQVWRHCDVTLWSPLLDIMQTPIPSNQYLLPVTQVVLYTQMYPQSGTGLQELIQQNCNIRRHFASFIKEFFNVLTAWKIILTHLLQLRPVEV
jgi:hypothetical protein